jgi:thiol-disulfide isomerase/thioredoxin
MMRQYFILPAAILACFLHSARASTTHSGPPVGSTAPDFKAHNMVTGETTTLGALQGKVVIVTFWATWCPPCRRELPILEKAQEIVGKENLTVLAVNHKEKADASAIRRQFASWKINVIEDRNDWIAHLYDIKNIPHLFIVGRDGKILANHLGYGNRTIDELVSDINHALADQQPVEPEDSTQEEDSK